MLCHTNSPCRSFFGLSIDQNKLDSNTEEKIMFMNKYFNNFVISVFRFHQIRLSRGGGERRGHSGRPDSELKTE